MVFLYVNIENFDVRTGETKGLDDTDVCKSYVHYIRLRKTRSLSLKVRLLCGLLVQLLKTIQILLTVPHNIPLIVYLKHKTENICQLESSDQN